MARQPWPFSVPWPKLVISRALAGPSRSLCNHRHLGRGHLEYLMYQLMMAGQDQTGVGFPAPRMRKAGSGMGWERVSSLVRRHQS